MEKVLRCSSKSDASNSGSLITGDNHGHCFSLGYNESINLASSPNCTPTTISAIRASTHSMLDAVCRVQQRYKLLTYTNVQVCRIPHEKSIIDKIRFSCCFRQWQDHHISLEQSEIISTTNKEYTDGLIGYSTIEDISVWSKFKIVSWHHPFRIGIVTNTCIYLLRVNTHDLRDQLFYSIQWKLNKFQFKRILHSTNNAEVVSKEIMNIIDFTMKIPIEDVEIHRFPLEIISEILQQEQFNSSYLLRDVIEKLSPLLEKNYSSLEMYDFFIQYCRDSSNSQILIEMFAWTIEKILKYKIDYGKWTQMSRFVQEYLVTLYSQYNDFRVVEDFIKRMHGLTIICPFTHIPSRLISLCLAGINHFFEDEKKLHSKDKGIYRIYKEKTEIKLICYTKILETISTFDDWRHSLGSALQFNCFPNDAIIYGPFTQIFKNIIKNITEDTRCQVHRTVLRIYFDNFHGFEIFDLNNIVYDDDDEIISIILNKLNSCYWCRRKTLLLNINKILPFLMRFALRENESSLNTLCTMLELNAIENCDTKLELISTLKSTSNGFKMYTRLCQRQRKLEELQEKRGLTCLTLPSCSNDKDLAELLSTGPFGNLHYLSLAFTNITNACAEHLIKLPALKNLDLSSTHFGDAGLELICEDLKQLEMINLSETLVTDKGLIYLSYMKTLRSLNFTSTHVTELAIQTLKDKLPALETCNAQYTDLY